MMSFVINCYHLLSSEFKVKILLLGSLQVKRMFRRVLVALILLSLQCSLGDDSMRKQYPRTSSTARFIFYFGPYDQYS